MDITQAELRKKKKLAESIIKANGKNIDNLLGNFYQKIIDDNTDVIEKALENYQNNQNKTTHYQSNGGN